MRLSHLARFGHERDTNSAGNCRACAKRYREAHRSGANVRKARWRLTHPEHNKAYNAAWTRAHPEKARGWCAAWRAKDPEAARGSVRKWHTAHPEYGRIAEQRRRAREASAGGTHSIADISKQLRLQRGRCYWCKELMGSDYHVDHVVPLCRGGSNSRENIVVACRTCNLRKGQKMPAEFAGVLL